MTDTIKNNRQRVALIRQKQTGREWTGCHFLTSTLGRLRIGQVNLLAVSRQLFNSTPKCWCLPLSLSGFPRWWFERLERTRGTQKGKGEWRSRGEYIDETDSTFGVKKYATTFWSVCAHSFCYVKKSCTKQKVKEDTVESMRCFTPHCESSFQSAAHEVLNDIFSLIAARPFSY